MGNKEIINKIIINYSKKDQMKKEQIKKEAKEYAAFVTDVAKAMMKHKVTDMVCIFGLNGSIRNSYLPLSGSEHPLYCNISDAINDLLTLSYAKSGDKFNGTINLKK